jgi:hypothetical protein
MRWFESVGTTWYQPALHPVGVATPRPCGEIRHRSHRGFKTNRDLERCSSDKFATNALVMALGVFAYNILRAIGKMGLLGQLAPIRHPAKRRRIRTEIHELIYLAGRLISTGRRLI